MTQKEISRPIKKELLEFEKFFSNATKSKVPLLGIITNYILRRNGKQFRPTLVLLCGKINGEITKSTYIAASMIELMHTANTVHNDIIDESYMKRSRFSINSLWKSKVAVLLGDFLLSKGLLLAIDNNENELLKTLSFSVKDKVEGELIKIESDRKSTISEEKYFEILHKTKASFLSSCTAAGAISNKSSEDTIKSMKFFGVNLALAQSLSDDEKAFSNFIKYGNKKYSDYLKSKTCLSLIYTLEQCNKDEKDILINILFNNSKNKDLDNTILSYINKYNSLEYSTKKIEFYSDAAIKNLQKYNESNEKSSLIAISNNIKNQN